MKYKIFIQRSAQKELADLQSEFYDKVKNAIWELADEPRPEGCRKLAGRDGWRIRVGNYRVIYEIYDANRTVTVLHIGHRRDIYR
ncbi:MAG TPA: type II toxin-antitoxin system RelE/ParE family toxin [bacterium]|nr:type II toxin-antitoxin system RelE/ParE family toxin [bacterium]